MSPKESLFQWHDHCQSEGDQRNRKNATDQERKESLVIGQGGVVIDECQERVHSEDGTAQHGLQRTQVETFVEGCSPHGQDYVLGSVGGTQDGGHRDVREA